MSWSARFKARNVGRIPITADDAARERAEDEAAERAAILAEPRMPPPGTPERERLDREQAAWLAGLRKAAAIRPQPRE
jgi:hypothetical protein